VLDPKKGKLCGCGCGEPAPIAPYTNKTLGWVKGGPKRFINGHNRKGRGKVALTFNKSIGRWVINCRDGTRILYYRAVMENKIGRSLKPKEVVHHKDEDPTNDDPDNLVLYANNAEHHRAEHIDPRRMSEMGKKGLETRWGHPV